MLRRPMILLFSAAVLAAGAAATTSFAGDPKAPPNPKEPASRSKLPQRFLEVRVAVKDLAPGASGPLRSARIGLDADGNAWLNPASILEPESKFSGLPAGYSVTPIVTRVDATTYDVDVTGCERLWSSTRTDGTVYKPANGSIRVRRFTRANEAPCAGLPPRLRGERLWALAPGETAWVSAYLLCADRVGQGWIDMNWIVGRTRFEDSGGPAIAVTASERDVVKFDVTGTTYQWFAEDFPKIEELPDEAKRNGHTHTTFTVTSFTRDGKTSARLPAELMVPLLRDAKPGTTGFVGSDCIRIDPAGRAWVHEYAPVMGREFEDYYGHRSPAITVGEGPTCSLDVTASKLQITGADFLGRRFPPDLEAGATLREVRWYRVTSVRDADAAPSDVLPARCRTRALWEFLQAEAGYVSCRCVWIGPSMDGFVPTWAPVSATPFEDELGPAVRVLVTKPGRCVVDLGAARHRWTPRAEMHPAPVPDAEPGGPSIDLLTVTEFIAPPAPR